MTSTAEADANRPLILLVDDDEDSRFLYAHYLSTSGFRVAEAADGREGVALADELAPAVIVMDLSLPVMDGWEALAALKANERTSSIPVVALTGYAIAKNEPRNAFSGVLVKPCLPEQLAKQCAKLLEGAARVDS